MSLCSIRKPAHLAELAAGGRLREPLAKPGAMHVLGTAGLLTLFVDLQFDWFDTLPHLWVPIFGIGTLLLCWLVRDHLSRIVAPTAAMILASTLVLSVFDATESSDPIKLGSGDQSAPARTNISASRGIPTEIQHGLETKTLLRAFFEYY
jgi:hypothetical protein